MSIFTNAQSSYYLSSSEGSDKNKGTQTSPWQSLEKISNTRLKAGDKVFFKRGDLFIGHFKVNGSGSKKKPIVIDSYGNGNLPIISGAVGAENGGDHREAVLIHNNDNIHIQSIEVQNNRLTNRKGVRDQDAYGIHVLNDGNENLKNFIFTNLVIKNVYAPKPILKEKGESAFNGLEVAGIRFFTSMNKKEVRKNIQNVLVQDSYFTNLQRLGIHIKHAGGGKELENTKGNSNLNFVFKNNKFFKTGGTCILPIRTYNCLIEKNVFEYPGDNSDSRMANRGSAVWTWRCVNTVIQYNDCLHIRGYLDSHGIHVDHENINTFIQYNYMEDCEGGFVEILGGNINSVYRFNISVNDGWRANPKWKTSNHTIWINNVIPRGKHYPTESYIYNNTVFVDQPYGTSIDIKGKNNYIYNNIFQTINKSNIGNKQVHIDTQKTKMFMQNNLYFGSINKRFKGLDSNPINANANFIDAKSMNKNGFQLKASSKAIDSGIALRGPALPGAGKGIFKDIPKYSEVDFYGNPVNMSKGKVNIGACNAKNGAILK